MVHGYGYSRSIPLSEKEVTLFRMVADRDTESRLGRIVDLWESSYRPESEALTRSLHTWAGPDDSLSDLVNRFDEVEAITSRFGELHTLAMGLTQIGWGMFQQFCKSELGDEKGVDGARGPGRTLLSAEPGCAGPKLRLDPFVEASNPQIALSVVGPGLAAVDGCWLSVWLSNGDPTPLRSRPEAALPDRKWWWAGIRTPDRRIKSPPLMISGRTLRHCSARIGPGPTDWNAAAPERRDRGGHLRGARVARSNRSACFLTRSETAPSPALQREMTHDRNFVPHRSGSRVASLWSRPRAGRRVRRSGLVTPIDIV